MSSKPAVWRTTRRRLLGQSAAAVASLSVRSFARAADCPGVTDAEIKVGQTVPYSGPTSAYSANGRAALAYFEMLNRRGGVGGRRIRLISVDDAGNPAKTLEQTRRLVEQEQVAFMFQTVGTAANLAIRDYLNAHEAPQLFVGSGSALFSDPKHFPWTMGYLPGYRLEAEFYAKRILTTSPDARIAVLYQGDDFGKDYLVGLTGALGLERASMIVRTASYDIVEPTVDSEVAALQASGADVFLIAATPKFAAQAIRKSFDIGWSATRYLSYVSRSRSAVLKPAGLDRSRGVISALYFIDVSDPIWSDNPDVKAWKAFTEAYMSQADFVDANAASGYCAAATLAQVLEQCGEDLSRKNIMRQAANLKNFKAPLLLPGVTINTSPDNYSPIRQLQLVAFDGQSWRPLADR